MRIESYSYGNITVDGKTYFSDLIVFPNRIRSEWWRKEGHSLSIIDLNEVVKFKPEILVVGKGTIGRMDVPYSTKLALKERNIEIIDARTDKAVQIFNEQIQMGRNVAGAFHLTC